MTVPPEATLTTGQNRQLRELVPDQSLDEVGVDVGVDVGLVAMHLHHASTRTAGAGSGVGVTLGGWGLSRVAGRVARGSGCCVRGVGRL
ncbi:hypothetical protein GCM10022221_31610 [Actinocorallia aurea]